MDQQEQRHFTVDYRKQTTTNLHGSPFDGHEIVTVERHLLSVPADELRPVLASITDSVSVLVELHVLVEEPF